MESLIDYLEHILKTPVVRTFTGSISSPEEIHQSELNLLPYLIKASNNLHQKELDGLINNNTLSAIQFGDPYVSIMKEYQTVFIHFRPVTSRIFTLKPEEVDYLRSHNHCIISPLSLNYSEYMPFISFHKRGILIISQDVDIAFKYENGIYIKSTMDEVKDKLVMT